MEHTAPEFRPLGIDGILVRFARVLTEEANARALAFKDMVEESGITGLTEVASSLTSVRVGFDPSVTRRADVQAALEAIVMDVAAQAATPKRHWRIPVAFGPQYAPQLPEAAALAGLTPAAAVDEICNQTLRVIALGFAPGQAYKGLMPPHWDIPRQSELSDHVPRGALICAVRQLIIWSADAPTGWRHIGQTAFEVYRPQSDDPFAFAPGDAVNFVHVSDDEMAALLADPDPDGGAVCEVSS